MGKRNNIQFEIVSKTVSTLRRANHSFLKVFFGFSAFIILTLSIFLIPNTVLYSQPDSIVFDTKGKDFRLAFLPNYHNIYSSGSNERTDSIYIFIVADQPTIGKIDYTDRYGNNYSVPFSIVNTQQIYTFKVSHYDFEVGSYNRSGEILDLNDARNQSERVARNTFHVTADNEVTVYAHSQAQTTSDAFLVLPTDVLGKEYIILSYNSDGSGYNGGFPNSFQLSTSATPSQFVIVATEDNTNVEINPSTDVYRHGSGKYNVTLNTGDCFLVQAKITENNLRSDLSGTSVESDKPIAIFSGHQRATVPVENNSLESRDFLCEQMLPLNTWGQNAYVIPYITPPDASNIGTDLYRVLIGRDGTDVFINGNNEGRYNRGEFFEKPITGSASIEANGPIIVAQFKKTSKRSGSTKSPLSDPFMMLVPPKEQFMSQYSVINAQAYENLNPWGSPDIVYKLHYIAIVAPKEAIDKTVIDANIIDKREFRQIQSDTNYYYANIQVSEGAHRVSSAGEIGVYVYGYGNANSYGYVGGMSMSRFDFKKPKILASDSCYKVQGWIYDNRPGDTKIGIVKSPDTSKVNMDVQIGNFNPYADSVSFRASLKDKYLDGKFEIFARDSIGQDTTAVYNIPGFTVSMDTLKNSTKLILYTNKYKTGRTYCEVFYLNNYGGFNQTVDNVYFKRNSASSINPDFPFDIDPGQTFAFELCFKFDKDTVITDTLYISDGCSDRAVMRINLEFKGDSNKPKLSVKSDSCRSKFDIVISDSLQFDSGISTIDTTIENCKFSIVRKTTKSIICLLEVEDYYKDAYFTITISDSSDNQISYSDTIQGFTLALPQFDSTKNKMDYGLEKIGMLYCDTLQLHNTGTIPYVVNSIYLKKNIDFSIPQYQFPLVIYPDEKLTVDVCFFPVNIYDTFEDTLIFVHNCLTKEVALTGIGDTIIYYGDADCGITIKATAHTIDKRYELWQSSPNPVVNLVKFTFNLPAKSDVKIKLHDILGNQRIETKQSSLPEGKNELELNLESLPQGVYLYTLTSRWGLLKGTLIKE